MDTYSVTGILRFNSVQARYYLDVEKNIIDKLESPMGIERTKQKLDIKNIDWTKVERIQRKLENLENNDELDFVEI